MLFRRFYDDNLAQASYMIGCERTGEALVIDPTVDTAQYLRAAGADRVRISHVTETHIHADFVSGSAALADAAGATLDLSAEGGQEYGYTREALRNANALHDESRIDIGDVSVEALHTPGHTPEHLTFLVFDRARGDDPLGAFTGDFIFVGDVGRPDLLERAAGAAGTMEKSARELYASIKRFSKRPDHLQIWPGHGAGSACGKQLGSMPQSTLGYERLFNWAFNCAGEKEFVRRVLEDQPVPPRYFGTMKRINRELSLPRNAQRLTRLSANELNERLSHGAFVIDARPAEEFALGHLPGTLNIPFNKSFLNWSGALVPYDRDVLLITDSDEEEIAQSVCSNLRKIGLTRVVAFAGPDVVTDWKSKGNRVEKVQSISATALHTARTRSDPQVVDVRGPDEWRAGHLPGALHIPLAALPERLDQINRDRPVVLQCMGGGRSAIATSYLQLSGWSNAANLEGGYERWVEEGFETETADGDTPKSHKLAASKRKRAATTHGK